MKQDMFKLKVLAFTLLIALTACNNFDELNTNPDVSTVVPPAMLATGAILNITGQATGKGCMSDDLMAKYIAWGEGVESTQYNKFGRSDFGAIRSLMNLKKMVALAPANKVGNSYNGLAHFIRAYVFFGQTMAMGDIPYSEALLGDEGSYYAKYDSQKDVFLGILNELEEADRLFAAGETFSGDPIYGGDPKKWRKLVNSFELKVLINLYKKLDDPDLKVKARFSEIVASKPLLASSSDNFQKVYVDKAGQQYPFYKLNHNYGLYPMISNVIMDKLKDLEDYRLFYYANPAQSELTAGRAENDWNAYVGVDPTAPFATLSSIFSSGTFSSINSRYLNIAQGEPIAFLSYSELQLILAESVIRGIIAGDAKMYYDEGVRAAMKFTAANTPAAYNHGMPITDAIISRYLMSPKVAFAADRDEQLKQVFLQKYLASFLQLPWNAYYEYRRVGYPELPVNPATNLNTPSDRIPVRWMYPQSEYSYNQKNVVNAVSLQFSGNDDVNELMWILK